ncbi:TPA: glycosyltransferase family 2 protein, partial [Enterococcus faecium]
MENLILKKMNENIGLATAQNIGIEIAKKEKCDYILLLDQDTIIQKNLSLKLLEEFTNIEAKDKDIGIIVPNYFENSNDESVSFTCKNERGRYVKKHFASTSGSMKIAFANSSGMFFKSELIDDVGNMKDEFFIDQIDVEFCKRVANNGYNIYVTNQVYFYHHVGDGENLKIGSKKIKIDNHNSTRKYFIARNSTLVKRMYKSDKEFSRLMNKRLLKFFIAIAFETDKLSRFRAAIRGVRDGYRGVIGD